MTQHPPTEQDLREALQTLAPADLDVRDFRARIDRLTVALPDESAGSLGELVPLQPTTPTPHRRRTGVVLVAGLAACVAAILAITLAVISGDDPHHRSTPLPAAGTSTPAAIRSMLFPGTVALHTYTGRGRRTFAVAPLAVPPHYSYSVYGTCQGPGNLRVGQSAIEDACRSAAFGVGNVVVHGRLTITADATTSWVLTLTIAPDARTNGGVQSPVDADLSGPDNAVRRSGTGSGTAHFDNGAGFSASKAGTKYQVRLVCHGTGVSLPDLTSDPAKGLSTKSCFAGFEYVWNYVPLTLPASVRVVAAPGTTWTISITTM